jgi:hypothetical protein
MPLPERDDRRLGEERDGGQQGELGGRAQQGDVVLARQQRVDTLVEVRLVYPDRSLRVALAEGLQRRMGQLGQGVAIEGHPHLVLLPGTHRARRRGEPLGVGEHLAGSSEQFDAVSGERDMAFVAVEQPDAEFAFQGHDGAGKSGLGEVQPLGGDPVVQSVGERREVAQIPYLHSVLRSRSARHQV